MDLKTIIGLLLKISKVSMCLFHDDRDLLTSIQRDLQKCGWIPWKCSHRLAMAVCSCRRNKGSMPNSEEYLGTKDRVGDLLNQKKDSLSAQLICFIENCLSAREIDYSTSQFLKVLNEGDHGNFSMLSRAAISSNDKQTEAERRKENNRQKKLTPQQIEIIKKKRKKKFNAVTIKLPVFPGNFTKLKLEKLGKSKVVYEPDYAVNNQNFSDGVKESFVKVWCDPKALTSIKKYMIDEATAVQARMDSERKARKGRKRQNAWMYLSRELEDQYQDDVLSGEKKGQLMNDFSLKAHKRTKDRSKCSHVKLPLEGGHCLQCFKPFSSLKDNTTCTYHEGYQVKKSRKYVWSCCSKGVNKVLDSYQVHSQTGCKTSVVHNWRTHAKSKGKNNFKE